jgi:Uma2 family endonuclease
MLVTPKRFTLDEYRRLVQLGFFNEDDRVELIRGEILQMAAKGTRHTTCCRNLLEELPSLIKGLAKLQCQDPIVLPSGSEPEPDFAIVRNQPDNYLSGHPTPADILLVIEIADASLHYDQDVKIELYAEAGISDYWIFNLPEQRLETYSEPYQDPQGKFDYAQRYRSLPNKIVSLPCFPDLSLDLAKIFP